MKKNRLIVALASTLLLAVTAPAWTATMSVQVREGKVLDKPNFFGKLIRTLSYGQAVSTQSEQGGWYELSSGNGWIHGSALTSKSIVMQSGSGQAATGASGEEMVLAGKGFNAEVESSYRAQGLGDYATVDQMERTNNFSGPELSAFLTEGGLKGSGGGK